MERAIFFESNEGRLHRCIFAGLDNNNCPQWVMVDQCDEVMTLQDYMDANCMEDGDMRVLCLEGETLESTTMAQLLGAVLQGYPIDKARALSEAIKNLKKMGIVWKHERLQLELRVFEYYEEVNHRDAYRFYIYCSGYGPVLEMDNFFTMKALMNAVRCYFDALEIKAGIGLRKAFWLYDANMKKELDNEDIKMFDTIE